MTRPYTAWYARGLPPRRPARRGECGARCDGDRTGPGKWTEEQAAKHLKSAMDSLTASGLVGHAEAELAELTQLIIAHDRPQSKRRMVNG